MATDAAVSGLSDAAARPGSRPARPRGRHYRMAMPSWSWPVLLFLVAFFVAPLAWNVLRSLTIGEAASDTWIFYRKLFMDPYYRGVVLDTLKVSLLTTLACLIVGYPVAYFMVRFARRWNSLILFCLVAPLLTSIIMRTFGWNVLLARRGLFNAWLMSAGIIERPFTILNEPIAVYLGLVHVLAPFMVLSISAVLQGVDVRLEEAARILGATRWQSFLRITLPLSLDGIATGCILVFVLTNGSFLTMLLLGGGQVTTLSLLIYQQFNLTGDVGFAAAMGNVLLLLAFAALVLQARFVRRKVVA